MTLRHLRLFAVCAALAAPALGGAPAFAQTAQVDAATLAKQRQLFDQGNKLYDQGKLPQAEASYLEAWKLKKSYDVAGNLGNLEADMNKPRQAAEFLSYAIREFPAGGRPQLRDALIKRLAEVQSKVGTLRVKVSKPGAEIFVDQVSVGLSPIDYDLYLDPGTHTVEARLEGYPPASATVTLARGKGNEVGITLVAKTANKAVIYGGIGVAGAAAVAGAVFAGLSAAKAGSASSLRDEIVASPQKGCPPPDSANLSGKCADLKSALDAKATFGSAAVWSFVGAGAVGAATLIYGLTAGGSGRSSRSGLVVTPVVAGQGGGLFVSGSF
jgi:hypothetical protein